jgi:hypothetical protein
LRYQVQELLQEVAEWMKVFAVGQMKVDWNLPYFTIYYP